MIDNRRRYKLVSRADGRFDILDTPLKLNQNKVFDTKPENSSLILRN